MKVHITKNGKLKVILQPEDDIERIILQEIAKNPVEVTIPDRCEILGENITDSMIISNIKPTL